MIEPKDCLVSMLAVFVRPPQYFIFRSASVVRAKSVKGRVPQEKWR